MTPTVRRPRLAASVAVATVLVVFGFALSVADADETTVSTETADPSRELQLLDLTGEPLERLELRDGVPRGFETRVIDRDQSYDNEFQVNSKLNNLHRLDDAGGLIADDFIPSGNVDLGYATDPAGALGMEVGADVTGNLATAAPISCGDVQGLLSLSLIDDDPICNLIGDLLGILDLSLLDSTDTIEFSGSPLPAALDGVAIDDLDLAQLPLVPGEGDTGAYSNPDCTDGIAAAHCDGTSPTLLRTLQGSSNSALATEIQNRLIDMLESGDLVGADGPLTVSEVLSAMNESTTVLKDSAGNDLEPVGQLADAIGQYDPADQVTLINDLLAATLDSVGLADLARLQGTHRSFPSLTVDTGGAVGGNYEGTLTVTLMDVP